MIDDYQELIERRRPKGEAAILLKSDVKTICVFVGKLTIFFIPLSEERLHSLQLIGTPIAN